MDRLAAMQAFVKVVELGSFSAAADQLDLSKSAVSKMVRGLEDHLGARLLNRTTRRLGLTEAGGRYVEEVGRILADLAEIEAATAEQRAVPRGRLKVNAPMSFGLLHLAPLLPGLLQAYPELTVDLTLNDRVVDLIDEGFDVALRIGRLRDSSLIARKLCEVDVILVASPEYVSTAAPLQRAGDLARHHALLYAYGPLRDEWRLEVDGEVVDVPVRGRLRANNGEVLARAAVDGLGIALVPDFIAQPHLARGGLVRVLTSVSGGRLPVHALYPGNRHPLAKLTAFVDYLKRHLGNGSS